jgi:hypothetical protein
VDITALLADFGFAPRTAMASELAERLRYKLLPTAPRPDASELFMLALPTSSTRAGCGAGRGLLSACWPADPRSRTAARRQLLAARLLDAITYCAGQILATGFAPELRLRMSEATREEKPFHAPARRKACAWRCCTAAHHDRRDAVQRLRASGWTPAAPPWRCARIRGRRHLGGPGVPPAPAARAHPARAPLLDCLLAPRRCWPPPAAGAAGAVGARAAQRALIATNSSLLAAKVAERSAETGEHYITRTGGEYLAMRKAAGGGLVMAATTLAKFGCTRWRCRPSGAASGGVNYAISFVLIQLLHFTVATKQPAMTAPAMAQAQGAGRRRGRRRPSWTRSRTWCARRWRRCWATCWCFRRRWRWPGSSPTLGRPAIDAGAAQTLDRCTCWAIAAVRRLHRRAAVCLQHHRRLGGELVRAAPPGFGHPLQPAHHRRAGAAPRRALGAFLRNISGLAANISLGFMLG